MTITVHEAKTHLSRYLVDVENGCEILIARGKKPVARLVPLEEKPPANRPRVGQTIDAPFNIPDSAFAPLDERELAEMGL
jgi:antitoxin (DNA-binding transcriptional repressor) of toxin-antitoxin stability system